MTDRPPPRFQLVKGDQYNLALGVLTSFILAACKDVRGLPPFLKMQLRAYTIWNLAFCGVRVVFGQSQWDPFLAANSFGICCGFRTAMCQGIDENMRRKLCAQLALSGLDLPRWQFVLTDHAIHTVPPLVLFSALARRSQHVHPMNCVYAMVIATWFAFRQGAQLDSSDIYVPHPWRRAWLSIVTSILCTPSLVDALIARNRGKAALVSLVALVPYLTTRLDPGLRRKYKFEYELARHTKPVAEETANKPLPRVASTPLPGRGEFQ
jgi:hypothetical protein